MSAAAELLVVALQADADGRLTAARERALHAIGQGVGGFVLYGGDQDAVRAFTKEVQQRSRIPLLVGADLERGAGQQFTGATGLPPLAALAWLGDAEALRRAARLTAREARTMGVNWDLAPVVDLEFADDAALVGTRSLGADPVVVGRMAAEWITACQAEGVLACAKHFPGLGRVALHADGDATTVRADRDALHETDLVPFRAAIDAGVATMMTAHAAYPALDPGGAPAPLSRELLQWLLRQQMRYDNLVVAHLPSTLRGPSAPADEGEAAVRALAAGCDVLLAPTDVAAVAGALDRALGERRLDAERVRQSVRRRLKWAQWAAPPNDWRRPTASDSAWGAQLCDRVVHLVRGTAPPLPRAAELVVVNGGAPLDARRVEGFVDTLRTAGHDVRATADASPASAGEPVVLGVFPGAAAEHGDVDALEDVATRVKAACAGAVQAGRLPVAVLFAHPRLASAVPEEVPLLCAWTGDVAMQRAAARWLAARRA